MKKVKNTTIYFLVGLLLIILLLMLTALSCPMKRELSILSKNPSKDPQKEEICEGDFKMELANESFEKAFTIEKDSFERNDIYGSYDAKVTVNLSAMTRDNGFVSNHVWIHPDSEKAALPFVEMGTVVPANNTGGGTDVDFNVASKNANAAPVNFDYRYCGYGMAVGGYYTVQELNALSDINVATALPSIFENPPIPDQVFLNDLVEDIRVTKVGGNVMVTCQDYPLYGSFITSEGKARQGIVKEKKTGAGPASVNNFGDIMSFMSPGVTVEKNIDNTGVYYLRDNAGYELVEKDVTFEEAGGDVILEKYRPIVHNNDTNAFYDEVLAVFDVAGAAMATLGDVFPSNQNKGMDDGFAKQPKAKRFAPNGNVDAEFDEANDLASRGVIRQGDAGSSSNGGWQKVFTIKSCDKKMQNGFAMAYNLGEKNEADAWKRYPTISYNATHTTHSLPSVDAVVDHKTVVLRPGGVNDETDHVMLIESIVTPAYNGNNNLGFFTLRHDGIVNIIDDDNAFATKGVLVCRSALALNGNDGKNHLSDVNAGMLPVGTNSNQNKETLGGYENTLTGYFDGHIDDKNKGLGMTCYLGLSALWPEAIDGAQKAQQLYTTQFEDDDKKTDNQFDVSDKYLGILMVGVVDDATIGDDLLKPIFADRLGNNSTVDGNRQQFQLSQDDGKAALQKIKADGKKKIVYKHGVVTMSFVKEALEK